MLTHVANEMATIAGKRVRKVATHTEKAGGVEVVEAAVRAYQASLMMSKACPFWDRNARRKELRDATQRLLAGLNETASA